jgi:hypothetical protein
MSNQVGGDYPIHYFNRDDLINYSWIGAHSSKMTRQSCKYKKNATDFFIDFMIIFEELGVGKNSGIFISDKSYGVYRRGVGISAKTNKVRNALIDHLNDIGKNHKIHRDSICSSAIYLIYQDVRKKSDTLARTIGLFAKFISLRGIRLFLSTIILRRRIKL